MSDNNAQLARRWFEEVWNARRFETVEELAAPGCLGHHEDGDSHGSEEWKRMFAQFSSAFPDLRIAIEDVIADGSRAVVRWRASGSHVGQGLGLTPTGRRFEARGTTWFRFENGKIVEGWDCWNLGGLLAQLAKPA